MGAKTKILVVDPHSRELSDVISEMFAKEAVVTCTKNHDKVLELYLKHRFDLIVVNKASPGLSSLAFAEKIKRESANHGFCGILLIMPQQTEETFIDRLWEKGFDDFCIEGRLSSELAARMRNLLRFKLLTDGLNTINRKLSVANRELETMTITDELTGLHNMRYFHSRLQQELSRANRYNVYLSLIMFDLDDFKKVNDTCNHLMGSHVLTEIGHIVKASIRCDDIAARFGGDEFVILLPETQAQGASQFALRLVETVAQTQFEKDDYKSSVTISLGVATFSPETKEFATAYDFLKQADKKLYEAKLSGKNRICS